MGSYLETDGIRFPVFVDDKLGMGNTETLEEMNWRMRILEITKKYKYNNKKGKTEWMMIRNNRRKNEEKEVELEVNSGKIGRTTKYKYHGDMYDEKGTNESKIESKEDKINLMVNDINRESSEKKVGRAALSVRLMLTEIVITPTVLSSTETWHNITQHEQQKITQIHKDILTKTLQLPRYTPYMGIISELNILPFVYVIWYKKLMWYHRITNSNDERKAKEILFAQMKSSDNWFTELTQFAKESHINIEQEFVKSQSYEQYKRNVKQKIRGRVNAELEQIKRTKTKMRNISPGKRQQYLDHCTISEASCIMKLRLNMVHAKANYGGGRCNRCNAEETTEHVLNCETEGEMKYDYTKMEDVQWLKKINIVYKHFDEQYPIKGLKTNNLAQSLDSSSLNEA